MKALLALVPLAMASVATSSDMPGETRIVDYPLVHRVMCEGGDIRGSAFRIAPTLFATAAHVAALDGCTLDGDPVSVAEINGILDSAVIQAGKPKGGAFPVSCAGFTPGHWYYAVGYAYGAPVQMMVPVYAVTRRHMSGMQIFKGPELFIGGMSGGPVMDSAGNAVGVVNARNVEAKISFSRAFKDTVLCR